MVSVDNFDPFGRNNWFNLWVKIETAINHVRNISSLNDMKKLNWVLNGEDQVMTVHIIKTMNIDEKENFIDKLTSFIIKWYGLLEEAESDPITRIESYFFSTDLINFNIVFHIGINHYIYSSSLDAVFISRRQ